MDGVLVDALCRLLATAGVGAYDPDAVLPVGQTPITVNGLPPDGDLAVSVTTYPGGPEPDSRNGWEYPRLQVRVRGANSLDALDLDRACFDVLQASPGAYPLSLPGGVWLLQDCYALQSEAQPLGPDSNARQEFVRNYQLSTELLA